MEWEEECGDGECALPPSLIPTDNPASQLQLGGTLQRSSWSINGLSSGSGAPLLQWQLPLLAPRLSPPPDATAPQANSDDVGGTLAQAVSKLREATHLPPAPSPLQAAAGAAAAAASAAAAAAGAINSSSLISSGQRQRFALLDEQLAAAATEDCKRRSLSISGAAAAPKLLPPTALAAAAGAASASGTGGLLRASASFQKLLLLSRGVATLESNSRLVPLTSEGEVIPPPHKAADGSGGLADFGVASFGLAADAGEAGSSCDSSQHDPSPLPPPPPPSKEASQPLVFEADSRPSGAAVSRAALAAGMAHAVMLKAMYRDRLVAGLLALVTLYQYVMHSLPRYAAVISGAPAPAPPSSSDYSFYYASSPCHSDGEDDGSLRLRAMAMLAVATLLTGACAAACALWCLGAHASEAFMRRRDTLWLLCTLGNVAAQCIARALLMRQAPAAGHSLECVFVVGMLLGALEVSPAAVFSFSPAILSAIYASHVYLQLLLPFAAHGGTANAAAAAPRSVTTVDTARTFTAPSSSATGSAQPPMQLRPEGGLATLLAEAPALFLCFGGGYAAAVALSGLQTAAFGRVVALLGPRISPHTRSHLHRGLKLGGHSVATLLCLAVFVIARNALLMTTLPEDHHTALPASIGVLPQRASRCDADDGGRLSLACTWAAAARRGVAGLGLLPLLDALLAEVQRPSSVVSALLLVAAVMQLVWLLHFRLLQLVLSRDHRADASSAVVCALDALTESAMSLSRPTAAAGCDAALTASNGSEGMHLRGSVDHGSLLPPTSGAVSQQNAAAAAASSGKLDLFAITSTLRGASASLLFSYHVDLFICDTGGTSTAAAAPDPLQPPGGGGGSASAELTIALQVAINRCGDLAGHGSEVWEVR